MTEVGDITGKDKPQFSEQNAQGMGLNLYNLYSHTQEQLRVQYLGHGDVGIEPSSYGTATLTTELCHRLSSTCF